MKEAKTVAIYFSTKAIKCTGVSNEGVETTIDIPFASLDTESIAAAVGRAFDAALAEKISSASVRANLLAAEEAEGRLASVRSDIDKANAELATLLERARTARAVIEAAEKAGGS